MNLEKKEGLFTFFLTRERPANPVFSAVLVRPLSSHLLLRLPCKDFQNLVKLSQRYHGTKVSIDPKEPVKEPWDIPAPEVWQAGPGVDKSVALSLSFLTHLPWSSP